MHRSFASLRMTACYAAPQWGRGGGMDVEWLDPAEGVLAEGDVMVRLGLDPNPVVGLAEAGGAVATVTGREVCVIVFAT